MRIEVPEARAMRALSRELSRAGIMNRTLEHTSLERSRGRLSLRRRYYVEVLEVDPELLEEALEIASGYTRDESLESARLEGLARSVLAERILELAKNMGKRELVQKLSGKELDAGDFRVVADEGSIEELLKTLQSLGYLKVKGDRIWV